MKLLRRPWAPPSRPAAGPRHGRRWGPVLRKLLAPPGLSQEEAQRLAALSDLSEVLGPVAYHGISNHLYVALHHVPGVDPSVLEILRLRHLRQIGRHLRTLADLRDLSQVFTERGIPWMVVKGPVLAEVLYDRPDLRTYTDIDLVVPGERFAAALRLLEERGCELLDQNWRLIQREQRGQLHVRLPSGNLADLHWHLINRRQVRRAFSISMESLFGRARPVDLGGLAVPTLDTVDTLLHLCLHAALAGADRLSWLKDVERSLVVEAPPWEAMVERAREWGAGPPVALILQRVSRTFGTRVPAEVARSLAPSKAMRLANAVFDQISPPQLSAGRMTPGVLWSQATRANGWATAAELLHRFTRPQRPPFRRREGEGLLVSLSSPSAGKESRQSFLDSVTRAGADDSSISR